MDNLFNDKPLEYGNLGKRNIDLELKKKDQLGLIDYAKALYKFIQTCDTPMTIGIQGDWGIGKTSLMNMINSYLSSETKEKYGIAWFNTWHYSLFNQDNYLGIAVINSLLDMLKDQFKIEDEQNIIESSKKILSQIAQRVSISVAGISINAKAPETEKADYVDIASLMLNFKVKFANIIQTILEKHQLSRIVIFIDDLDRVRPLKALELLESVKNFLDVESCIFVLAVDYEIVQLGMSEKLGQDLQKISGKSFFDKIIQLPFTMPSTSYDLGSYIRELLEKSQFIGKNELKDDEKDFYEEITTYTVGRNPRSIKRVINYAKLLELIRSEKSNINSKITRDRRKILYSVLCMQVAWPEIYNYFVKNPMPETIKNIENWEYIDKIPFINKLYDRTPDIDQLKNNISAFFDQLFDLLDTNSDGNISEEELKPIWDILYQARLTNEQDFSEPIDVFLKNLAVNDQSQQYFKFVKSVLKKSKWSSSSKVNYKLAGKRYVTIVYNRKQIGSLVTLQRRPFIFRLDIDENLLIAKIKEQNLTNIEPEKYLSAVEDNKLTGFGDTLINIDFLQGLDTKKSADILNNLFDLMASIKQ
ncbi:MAG: hypothetical protein H6627_04565 [Calditrichae bacterium]|nr:hypothetical protein [Calditrichia bacterium]